MVVPFEKVWLLVRASLHARNGEISYTVTAGEINWPLKATFLVFNISQHGVGRVETVNRMTERLKQSTRN